MSQIIRSIRKKLNLTQVEFAKYIGLEQDSYSYLENKGKSIPKSIQIILQEKYNINIEYLLTG